MTVTISEAKQLANAAERAVAYAGEKLAESQRAIDHWKNMQKEYGENHPVTNQAKQFAQTATQQTIIAQGISQNAYAELKKAVAQLNIPSL